MRPAHPIKLSRLPQDPRWLQIAFLSLFLLFGLAARDFPLWHAPLMRALQAFVDSTQEHVTGEVRLRLEPGRCFGVGRRAPKGLYDHDLATYDVGDTFRHEDSAGFVRLWGLSVETWSRRQGPGSR